MTITLSHTGLFLVVLFVMCLGSFSDWVARRIMFCLLGVSAETWRFRYVIAYRAGRGEAIHSIARDYPGVTEKDIENLLSGILRDGAKP